MSAVLRTVRLLDRQPGKATETREVKGITLSKGIPIPPRIVGKIDAALCALEVGESFEHKCRICSRKPLPGRKFMQRRQANGTYRVWRIRWWP